MVRERLRMSLLFGVELVEVRQLCLRKPIEGSGGGGRIGRSGAFALDHAWL